MKVKTTVNMVQEIEIDESQALEILCETLEIKQLVYDADTDYVIEDIDGQKCVCIENGNKPIVVDERAGLFVALRNVMVNMFPNLEFRGDDYIDRRWDDD